MIDMFSLNSVAIAAASFIAGIGLGHVYFIALQQTTDLILGKGSLMLVLGLTLGRLALLAGAFYVAVQFGSIALLSALAGVLLAKTRILKAAKA